MPMLRGSASWTQRAQDALSRAGRAVKARPLSSALVLAGTLLSLVALLPSLGVNTIVYGGDSAATGEESGGTEPNTRATTLDTVSRSRMERAQATLDEATRLGGSIYAPTELAEAQAMLRAAEEAFAAQSDRFLLFRSYKKAEQLLAKAERLALHARDQAVFRKSEAATAARNAADQARLSLDRLHASRARLEEHPRKPKGFAADLDSLGGRVEVLGQQYQGVEHALQAEDFLDARSQAEALSSEASALARDIETALALLPVGPPPTVEPNPYVARPDDATLTRGHFWNLWAEDPAGDPAYIADARKELRYDPVPYLRPSQMYVIAVHFAAYGYGDARFSVASRKALPSFVQRLAAWAQDQPGEVWRLRPIVLPGPLFASGPEVLEPLEIDVSSALELRRVSSRESEGEIWEELRQSVHAKKRPDFVFGELAFAVRTGPETGASSIGISLWDERNDLPVDELRLPVCITEGEDECPPERPVDSLAGPGILDLANSDSISNLPDAALHILDFGDHVAAVYHQPGGGAAGENSVFLPWTIAADLAEQAPEDFRKQLQERLADFKDSSLAVDTGRRLRKLLFKGDRGAAAEEAFRSFLASRGSTTPFASDKPARLFVRSLAYEGRRSLLKTFPAALLNFDETEDGFLGYRVKVEAPLPRQSFQGPTGCPRQWVMVLPRSRNGDADLEAALSTKGLSARFREVAASFELGSSAVPAFPDFAGFRGWLKKQQDWRNRQQPAAVLLLSHHESGTLRVPVQGTNAKATFTPEDLDSTTFKSPSVVILGSCSTATGDYDILLRSFNASGVGALIGANAVVSGTTTGAYLACLVETLEAAGSSPITVSDLHYKAQQCAWRLPDETSTGWKSELGPKVLAFTMVGNPSLTLCTPENP